MLFGQSRPTASNSSDTKRLDRGSRSAASAGKSTVGEASWYGPGFVGKTTASGEKFDPNKPTAASKRIALGSHAVVTNLSNGRSVRVKINDRGPYVEGRKIDLSRKAAQQLHMVHDGTTTVKIKVVEPPEEAER